MGAWARFGHQPTYPLRYRKTGRRGRVDDARVIAH